MISRLISSSRARSRARRSAVWSWAFRIATAALAASPSNSSRSAWSKTPVPVSLLETWSAPTVVPCATMGVAITLEAGPSPGRSSAGSNRGSRIASITMVVRCLRATSPTNPVPTGSSAPIRRWLAPPTANRHLRTSPWAIQSDPPSAPSTVRTVWNTRGRSSSTSRVELNSREMRCSRRSRSTSWRSDSAGAASEVGVAGGAAGASRGMALPCGNPCGARRRYGLTYGPVWGAARPQAEGGGAAAPPPPVDRRLTAEPHRPERSAPPAPAR